MWGQINQDHIYVRFWNYDNQFYRSLNVFLKNMMCMLICLLDGIHIVINVYLFLYKFNTPKPKLYPVYEQKIRPEYKGRGSVSVSTDTIPLTISKTDSQQKNTKLFLSKCG